MRWMLGNSISPPPTPLHPPGAPKVKPILLKQMCRLSMSNLHSSNICGSWTQLSDELSVLHAEGRQQAQPQVQHQSYPADGPGSADRDRSLAAEHDHDPSHNTHAQTDGEDTFFDAEEGKPWCWTWHYHECCIRQSWPASNFSNSPSTAQIQDVSNETIGLGVSSASQHECSSYSNAKALILDGAACRIGAYFDPCQRNVLSKPHFRQENRRSTFLLTYSLCFQLNALPCCHADWQWADEMPSWGDDPATKDAVRSDHEVRTAFICRACL